MSKWFALIVVASVAIIPNVFAAPYIEYPIPPTNAFSIINGTWGTISATTYNGFVTLVEGTGITLTYDNVTNSLTIDSTTSGPSELYCSGTDKFRAYNETTNSFICDTDQTAAGGGGPHTLLNSTSHTDTANDSPSKGSIIIGTATVWDELIAGGSNTVLTIDDSQNIEWIKLFTDYISGVADPRTAILTPGGAVLQYSNTPAKNTINGTNHDYMVLDYDATTSETATWQFETPVNFNATENIVATVRFQVASGTNGVCFDGSWLGVADNDAVDSSFGTIVGGCDSSTQTNKVENATLTFTSAQHGLNAGDVTFFKLSRDVADATDTNTNDARVIDVRVRWK